MDTDKRKICFCILSVFIRAPSVARFHFYGFEAAVVAACVVGLSAGIVGGTLARTGNPHQAAMDIIRIANMIFTTIPISLPLAA